MKKIQDITYDYIFIGLGASNSLVLLSLIQKKLLENKRVAIFENESKTINDKTFCFWSGENETIVSDLAPIISNRFNTIKVSQSNSQNINDQPYHYIRSIDLYNHTLQKINQENIKIFRLAVHKITSENEIYTVHSQSETCRTHYIFDSRPPSISLIDKKQIYLDQSFYGLHIKCDKDAFQKNSFEMMNFNVDQSDYTQFVYVIPFNSNEALVELTRFGKDKIDLDYAEQVLSDFILKHFGNYEILADESGCIPMTTFINPPNPNNGILHTGASANLIKPSTGYGFKKMHEFAQLVSERIKSNKLERFNTITLDSKARFKFYDKLLLLILMYWPSKGKSIFTRLFEKHSVLTVFSFLDEKSSFGQELKIFASLPIFPFLKALYLNFKRENYLRYVYAFLIVLSYSLLSTLSYELADYFSYIVLFIGLLLIGIPHGALDHLLLKSKNSSLFLFVLKYLFLVVLYYTVWQFFPLIALIIFIIYSSFHFGESEIIESKSKIDSFFAYFKSFLLGLSILFFIIFTHKEESLSIISKLLGNSELKSAEMNYPSLFLFTAILSLIFIFFQGVLSKNKSYFGLLFLLILGLKVPLILAFTLYFIFQHSSNAWQHLKLGLNLNSNELYKKSSIYTLGALVVFILFFLNKNDMITNNKLISIFFIFIACISFPHFILMHIFYKNSQQK